MADRDDLKKKSKMLDALTKEFSARDDVPFNIEDFIDPKKNILEKAYESRNLYEEALANQILKNTGVPIPDMKAPKSKKEQFVGDILREFYPELSFTPEVRDNLTYEDLDKEGRKVMRKAHGLYFPHNKKVIVNNTDDLLELLATTVHEGAHGYDSQSENYSSKELNKKALLDELKKLNEGSRKKPINAEEAYDLLAKGHHLRLPSKRDANTFGAGALKSFLKSGKFKSLIPGAGAAGAALAGSADEALADALIPGGLEAVGRGSDKPSQDVKVTRKSPDPTLAIPSEKEYRAMREFGTGEEVETPEESPAVARMRQNMGAGDKFRDDKSIKLEALKRLLNGR